MEWSRQPAIDNLHIARADESLVEVAARRFLGSISRVVGARRVLGVKALVGAGVVTRWRVGHVGQVIFNARVPG